MIKTRTQETPEVDMTPMIDIVFQLIIFFMVVMAIAVVYGVAIKFPPPGQGSRKPQREKEKNIIVYVQSDWIDRDHYLQREGTLKLNGEEIPLAYSEDRAKWDDERENGYKNLEYGIQKLLDQGYKKDVLVIQGDMKTYHGKILNVIDKGKGLGIEGFSLVPPSK